MNFGNFNDELTKNVAKIKHVEEKLIANPNSHRFNSYATTIETTRENDPF